MIGGGTRGPARIALLAAALTGLPGPSAWAQAKVTTSESTALPDSEPGSERWVDWLSGGAWSSSRGGDGRGQPAPYQPTWLPDWSARLQAALQALSAGRAAPPHPLLKVTPTVLSLELGARVEPAAAAAQPWSALACADGGAGRPALQLQVQVLAETATGQATLGLHWVCRGDERQWQRQVRLIAEVDTLGRCSEAHGVAIRGPGALERRSDPTAMPLWPLQGAHLDSGKPAWALAAGRGWLVQVEVLGRVGWHSERSLPSLEAEDPNQPGEAGALVRQLWWLDRRGRPLAWLLSSGPALPTRPQPLPREAVLDLPMTAAQGPYLLQRHAVPSALGLPTRAGVWAWRLGERVAEAWSVALPVLDAEGTWQCQADAGDALLRCQFHGAGAVPLQLDEVVLAADAAGKRWRPPPRK